MFSRMSDDSLSRVGGAGLEIKECILRSQAVLSGLQLGLMAAEHRLSLALIWMSTRRLVLFLPASLCALPLSALPVNSINSMAATSSHAEVINKHPQMAHNDSLQSDVDAAVPAGGVLFTKYSSLVSAEDM